jgi:hypothetical protein
VVYVITHSAVQRNRHRWELWWLRGAAFTLTAVVAGGALGALLGFTGSLLGSVREPAAAALAALGMLVGLRETRGIPLRMPQFNRETSRRRRTRPFVWAIYNGAELGAGIRTRIGFWAWYLVPLGALLLGRPLLGALVYASYGAARGLAPWLLLGAERAGVHGLRLWLLHSRSRASLFSGFAVVALCSVILGYAARRLFV